MSSIQSQTYVAVSVVPQSTKVEFPVSNASYYVFLIARFRGNNDNDHSEVMVSPVKKFPQALVQADELTPCICAAGTPFLQHKLTII